MVVRYAAVGYGTMVRCDGTMTCHDCGVRYAGTVRWCNETSCSGQARYDDKVR